MPLSTTPRKLPTHKDQELGNFPDNLPEAIAGGLLSVVTGAVMISLWAGHTIKNLWN